MHGLCLEAQLQRSCAHNTSHSQKHLTFMMSNFQRISGCWMFRNRIPLSKYPTVPTFVYVTWNGVVTHSLRSYGSQTMLLCSPHPQRHVEVEGLMGILWQGSRLGRKNFRTLLLPHIDWCHRHMASPVPQCFRMTSGWLYGLSSLWASSVIRLCLGLWHPRLPMVL